MLHVLVPSDPKSNKSSVIYDLLEQYNVQDQEAYNNNVTNEFRVYNSA